MGMFLRETTAREFGDGLNETDYLSFRLGSSKLFNVYD